MMAPSEITEGNSSSSSTRGNTNSNSSVSSISSSSTTTTTRLPAGSTVSIEQTQAPSLTSLANNNYDLPSPILHHHHHQHHFDAPDDDDDAAAAASTTAAAAAAAMLLSPPNTQRLHNYHINGETKLTTRESALLSIRMQQWLVTTGYSLSKEEREGFASSSQRAILNAALCGVGVAVAAARYSSSLGFRVLSFCAATSVTSSLLLPVYRRQQWERLLQQQQQLRISTPFTLAAAEALAEIRQRQRKPSSLNDLRTPASLFPSSSATALAAAAAPPPPSPATAGAVAPSAGAVAAAAAANDVHTTWGHNNENEGEEEAAVGEAFPHVEEEGWKQHPSALDALQPFDIAAPLNTAQNKDGSYDAGMERLTPEGTLPNASNRSYNNSAKEPPSSAALVAPVYYRTWDEVRKDAAAGASAPFPCFPSPQQRQRPLKPLPQHQQQTLYHYQQQQAPAFAEYKTWAEIRQAAAAEEGDHAGRVQRQQPRSNSWNNIRSSAH